MSVGDIDLLVNSPRLMLNCANTNNVSNKESLSVYIYQMNHTSHVFTVNEADEPSGVNYIIFIMNYRSKYEFTFGLPNL